MKIPLHVTRKAVNALASTIGPLKATEGILAGYRYWSALHILRAAQGYLRAAGAGDIYSSRLLLRPIIEAFLKLSAVRHTPATLYELALDEYNIDRMGLNRGDPTDPKGNRQFIEGRVADFNEAYKSEFPSQPISYQIGGEKMKLSELEKAADIPGLYEVHYRHACAHSHGSLRAMSGGLDLPDEFPMMNVMVAAACIEAMRSLTEDFDLDAKTLDRAKRDVEKLL